MSLEIYKIPNISTAHLTEKVANVLTEKRNDNPWVPCMEWQHGFLLFLDDLESNEEEVPQCLVDIRNWRLNLEQEGVLDNSRWVRLDCDAAKVDGLATYDW